MENNPNPEFELMYRPPGRQNHQNITEILDELMIRLEKVEQTLHNLEKNS